MARKIVFLLFLIAAASLGGLSILGHVQALAHKGTRLVHGLLASSTSLPAPSAQSKDFKKTVDFEPGGNLTFTTDKGSIHLVSWDRNQIEIVARIDPPEDVNEDYGKRVVEATRIEVLGSARSLTIRSNFEDVPYRIDNLVSRDRRLPDIHYEVRAPRSLNLELNADRCRKVEVSGFAGRFNIETDRSPFAATDLDGDLHLRVDRGSVKVARLQGSLDINTDRTDSEIEVGALRNDSKVNVGRGDMALMMPGSQGLTVKANTGRRERFDTDFPIASTTFGKERVEGTINGGGPTLTISGDRSNVRLKRN
jgi:hypothetical protein